MGASRPAERLGPRFKIRACPNALPAAGASGWRWELERRLGQRRFVLRAKRRSLGSPGDTNGLSTTKKR